MELALQLSDGSVRIRLSFRRRIRLLWCKKNKTKRVRWREERKEKGLNKDNLLTTGDFPQRTHHVVREADKNLDWAPLGRSSSRRPVRWAVYGGAQSLGCWSDRTKDVRKRVMLPTACLEGDRSGSRAVLAHVQFCTWDLVASVMSFLLFSPYYLSSARSGVDNCTTPIRSVRLMGTYL